MIKKLIVVINILFIALPIFAFPVSAINFDAESIYNSVVVIYCGDAINSICIKMNIDFASNINTIKAINGISDPNQINVGQTIYLPIS